MAGQPTKYNDEVLAKAMGYLEDCPDTIPSAVGLAVHLKVARKTLYNWAAMEGNTEFSGLMNLVNDAQHHQALNKGLSGDYNSAITKLVLANHGYHEKQETISVDDKPIDSMSDAELLEIASGGDDSAE